MKYPIGTKLRKKTSHGAWHCCVTGYSLSRGEPHYKLDWYKNGAFEHKNEWTDDGVRDYMIPIVNSIHLDEELFVI